jgi:prophage DNA circulation protein
VRGGRAYSVVAFIVTVQLVEKRVKRMLGMLNVARRITQYKMVEMRLRMNKINLPKEPSQPEDSFAAMTSPAVLMAVTTEAVEDSMALTTLWEILPTTFDMSEDMAEGAAVRTAAASWRRCHSSRSPRAAVFGSGSRNEEEEEVA